jgi:hypothetical protein
MKAIDAIAIINREGKLTIELACDLPPGTHQAVVVLDEASLVQPESSHHDSPVVSEGLGKTTASGKTAWTVLREQSGTVEMPSDWAKEHDHYLYGTPKREL